MDLTKLLSELVEHKTLSSSKAYNRKVLAWIEGIAKDLGLFAENRVSLEYPSLLLTTQNTKTPKLWLQAHLDVVPGSIESFRPKINSGKLYGRGTYDMKFAIACYLKLLYSLRARLNEYDFGVMITTDEEVGGFSGVKYLLEEGYSSDICFIPDAGINWALEEKAKGIMRLAISVSGKSAHAAYPWLVKNSAHTIISFLHELNNHFSENNNKKNAHKSTASVTYLQTANDSSASNQIPSSVEATVDIRLASHGDRLKIDKLLDQLSAKYPSVAVDILAESDPTQTDLNNEYVTAWNKAALSVGHKPKKPTNSHGSSDARFFLAKGIPVIATRPNGGGAHSEKEWINLKDLEQFYGAIEHFVKNATKN